MKKGIHPENYRPVVFKDMSNGDMFLSRSTAKTATVRLRRNKILYFKQDIIKVRTG